IDIKASTPGVSNPSEWTGIYFKGIPVKLKAVPMEGFEFCYWEGVPDDMLTNETIEFVLEEDMNINAVFKPTSTEVAYGDANGDGKINSTDYALLKKYLLQVIREFSVPKKNMDLNGDGQINSSDYVLLNRYILDIIDEFPVE
ncbi:MAG: dockerin, partial [Clostridiaceae bacterium]|nr:dockerin [Clostridiaceae bacterium]